MQVRSGQADTAMRIRHCLATDYTFANTYIRSAGVHVLASATNAWHFLSNWTE